MKNLFSKIKTIFQKKEKSLPLVPPVHHIEPARELKPVPKEIITRTEHREPRKKETPEEYRARHQKRTHVQRTEKPKVLKQKSLPEKTEPVTIPSAVPWDISEFNVPVKEGKSLFQDLDIAPEILHAIFDLGFEYCTEVQAHSLPDALKGNDITAQAQTGTGKTAAFLITIFNKIIKYPLDPKRRPGTPRALILAPTRELVLQIEKDARSLGKYVPCSILALLGGIGYTKQQQVLQHSPCDILICTPGRLIDFMRKRLVNLSKIEILVIDEADRMLDMGFIADVKKIVLSTPPKTKRQTMFFSATMTGDVKYLAGSWTRQPVEVNVNPEEVTVQSVKQLTYITTVEEKPTLLYNLIMQKNLNRVLIFVNRRVEARKLKDTFERYGIKTALLSGEVEQSQRIKRLEAFRNGEVRVLVATDVASRGIHVEGISHVINYNMPEDIEEYVHRIGRTGRAGASGISINFADEDDSYQLHKVEEYLGKKIETIFPDNELLVPIPERYREKSESRETPSPEISEKKKYYRKRTSGSYKKRK